MASVHVIALLTLLVAMQPPATTSDSLSPVLTPALDMLCQEVECGQGQCQPSLNSTFFYECVCDPGWKQTISGENNGSSFLPCVIPNCTLNYSCIATTSSPAQQKSSTNLSTFDICQWTTCGAGFCRATSAFNYTCECNPGYYNLLNVSTFPCYQDCVFGVDFGVNCEVIGNSTLNQSPSPVAIMADDSTNQGSFAASSNVPGTFYQLALSMLLLAMP